MGGHNITPELQACGLFHALRADAWSNLARPAMPGVSPMRHRAGAESDVIPTVLQMTER
jgi:hypothetical protein